MLLLRLKLLVLILFCPFPFKFRKNFTSIPSRDCLACLTAVTRLYEKKAPFKRWVYKKCVDFFHVYCKSLFRKIIVSKRIPSPEVASPYSCSSPTMPMLPPVSISSKALPRVIPRISSTLGVIHTWGPLCSSCKVCMNIHQILDMTWLFKHCEIKYGVIHLWRPQKMTNLLTQRYTPGQKWRPKTNTDPKKHGPNRVTCLHRTE